MPASIIWKSKGELRIIFLRHDFQAANIIFTNGVYAHKRWKPENEKYTMLNNVIIRCTCEKLQITNKISKLLCVPACVHESRGVKETNDITL